jgi:putative transcriptional regulator
MASNAGIDFPFIRRQLNMTQEQFAHALGVSFSTVNRWEKGRTAPSRLAKERIITFCKEHCIKIEDMPVL